MYNKKEAVYKLSQFFTAQKSKFKRVLQVPFGLGSMCARSRCICSFCLFIDIHCLVLQKCQSFEFVGIIHIDKRWINVEMSL